MYSKDSGIKRAQNSHGCCCTRGRGQRGDGCRAGLTPAPQRALGTWRSEEVSCEESNVQGARGTGPQVRREERNVQGVRAAGPQVRREERDA